MVLGIVGVNMGIDEEEKDRRKIGLFFGIIASLGATLGIEFFVLMDYATYLAGPAIVVSLIISGLINLLIMFNYAELSSCISRVGAEYSCPTPHP